MLAYDCLNTLINIQMAKFARVFFRLILAILNKNQLKISFCHAFQTKTA